MNINLLPNLFKKWQLKKELQAIIYGIYRQPGIELFDVSVADKPSLNRMTFIPVNPIRDYGVSLAAVRNIAGMAGFTKRLKTILEFNGILKRNCNCICNVGLGFNRAEIKELKLYYCSYSCMAGNAHKNTDKQEGPMGNFIDKRNEKVVNTVLKKIGCEGQGAKIKDMIKFMAAGRFGLSFIGIDIEKHKPPGLKLYFEPEIKPGLQRAKDGSNGLARPKFLR